MEKILQGIQQFQDKVFPQNRDLFQRLAGGQQPETVFVTCSDSRISLDLMTQSDPGEMFVCRNAGNIVPSYGRNDAISASIEYALAALPIRDIVVCGHSDCGAMKGVMHPHAVAEMPRVKNWLTHARGALRAFDKDGIGTHAPEAVAEVGKMNVRLQLRHLLKYPQVASRLRAGSLRLHGWFYQIGSGEILAWNEPTDGWLPLREAAPRAATSAQGVLHA